MVDEVRMQKSSSEPSLEERVVRLFTRFGSSLVERGVVRDFAIDAAGGVKISLRRESDGKVAEVAMTGTTEVYCLDLDSVYSEIRTAYDDEGKLEALDDLLDVARLFLERQYHEEIHERDGKMLCQVIVLNFEAGAYRISDKSGIIGNLQRLRRSNTIIRRP